MSGQRWEYAHCVNELPALDEMGNGGWRVVAGSLRDAPWAPLGVWLMEREITG